MAKTEPPKIVFTAARLQAIKPPANGRQYVYDQKTPGLALCVTAAGNKTFYLYRWADGRPVRVRLGRFPDIAIDIARKAATEVAGQLASGRDLAAERQARRREATIKDLFMHWLETHAKPRKRSWRDDERMFQKYFVDWHGRRLSSIHVADVVAWHNRIGRDHGPVQANRCKALLATIFAKAFEVGYVGANPCKPVANFPEHSRERFLLPAEMKTFFTALAQEGEIWRDFFLLCLFTGARRGNVASMRWEEIDFAGGIWHVPAGKTKNKRPGVVALSPPAIAILESRRERANGSEWVFPSGRTDNHIVDPRKAWERVLGTSGIKNLRMHDLRRSLGSWQAAMGASLIVIGKSLGHADLKSTQIYSRLQVDPIKQSVTQAVEAMMLAGGNPLLTSESEKLSDSAAANEAAAQPRRIKPSKPGGDAENSANTE
jgi:integrase